MVSFRPTPADFARLKGKQRAWIKLDLFLYRIILYYIVGLFVCFRWAYAYLRPLLDRMWP